MRLIDLDPPTPRLAPRGRQAFLHSLLDEALRFAPEYGVHGFATHLPMALSALHALGAEPGRMRRFFDHDASELTRSDAVTGAEETSDWLALRGRFEALPRLRAHFAALLARDGRDASLRALVPALMPGIAAAAFHGAIRTAHAVESGHDGELAMALAYWAARWNVLPAPSATSARFETPAAWLDALDTRLREHENDWRPMTPLISDRMLEAAKTSAYDELGGATAGFGGTLPELARGLAEAAATRYAATRNFTVLHLATAARAVRVLGAWLDAREPMPASAWHAVAAASLASGVAWLPVSRAVTSSGSWDDVRRLACESDDDHVIKLVHAMVDENARLSSPAWLAAARRAVDG